MKLFFLPTKDVIVVGFLVLLSLIFVGGLASESQSPVLLNKSLFLWLTILLSGLAIIVLTLIIKRFPRITKTFRKMILLGLITIAFFEGVGWIFPQVLPLEMVQRLPLWTMKALPDRVFDRPELRLLRLKAINDPELGYRTEPNISMEIIDTAVDTGGGIGFAYEGLSDSQGFNNKDESLYQDSDILTTGDSFTQGWGVKFAESWPQQLATISNSRVLNLGTGSWSIYQYPRVMERYAPAASPGSMVIALLSWNDLVSHHYDYEDYRKIHPEVKGIYDYNQRKNSWWDKITDGNQNYLSMGYQVSKYIVPFTGAAYSVLRTPNYTYDRYPPSEFVLNDKEISLEFSVWDQYDGNEIVSNLPRVSEDLNRLVELGREINSEVYFLYIPYAEEVYIPILGDATDLNPHAEMLLKEHDIGRFNFRKYYDQYEAALGEHSKLIIDSTPYLQKFALEGEQLFWSFDPHPNATGFKRLGEFVANSVSARN